MFRIRFTTFLFWFTSTRRFSSFPFLWSGRPSLNSLLPVFFVLLLPEWHREPLTKTKHLAVELAWTLHSKPDNKCGENAAGLNTNPWLDGWWSRLPPVSRVKTTDLGSSRKLLFYRPEEENQKQASIKSHLKTVWLIFSFPWLRQK